jgi:hypothetical protein
MRKKASKKILSFDKAKLKNTQSRLITLKRYLEIDAFERDSGAVILLHRYIHLKYTNLLL